MLVPSTRLFTAGEIETGAYLNSSVTNLGNFMLGKPIFSAYTTTIPGGTPVPAAGSGYAILFDTEVIDRDNGHSTSSNTSRYTAQTAGWWYWNGTVTFAANATSGRGTYFRVNGSTISVVGGSSAGALGYATSLTSNALIYMNVGDYIELIAYSGVATTLAGSPGSGAVASITGVWVSS